MKIMKTLFLFLSISFSLHAQSDSLKVTFSEEKVETFEKTTLIDEYEKAFGGNRVVRSGLRVRIEEPKKGLRESLYFQYEQKINNSFSIIGSLSGGYNSKQGTKLKTSLEARWYYLMQKRLSLNTQKPNLTGSFLSIRGNYFSDGKAEQPTIKILSKSSFTASSSINPIFIKNYSLSALWGKQLGNNLEFGIMAGINYGNEFLDENLYYSFQPDQILEPLEVKNIIQPSFSTFSQIGIGMFYPKKTKVEKNYCEFLKCNYDVNQIFKINLNDALFIDKYVQRLKAEVGFEQRILNSKFSLNTFASIEMNNFKTREILKFRDSVINLYNRPFQVNLPVYSQKNINDFTTTLAGSAQIRYYLITKNKTHNNLNGIYTGLEYSNRTAAYTNLISHPQYFQKNRKRLSSLSGIIGHQVQTSLGSFLDITATLGIEKVRFNYSDEKLTDPPVIKQFHSELSIKLGLTK
jgi:hypothetical protein